MLSVVIHFNSIKVQLELECKYKHYFYITFQFHKGTIRTMLWLL